MAGSPEVAVESAHKKLHNALVVTALELRGRRVPIQRSPGSLKELFVVVSIDFAPEQVDARAKAFILGTHQVVPHPKSDTSNGRRDRGVETVARQGLIIGGQERLGQSFDCGSVWREFGDDID